MAHLLENTGAGSVKFTEDEVKEFNTQLEPVKIVGERLPAAVLAFSGVETPTKK